ncbi:MAG: response regulator [Desulfobacterales bacterium]|nr:response regulator [Desulfobacterales bacterium]
MKTSVLNGMKVLAVDDEPDVLETLKEVVLLDAPECKIEVATRFEDAREKLTNRIYDLVILDLMGVQGFDLLKIASDRDVPSVVLTAHELNPEALKRSIQLGARAYFPKYKLSEIVAYLEGVLTTDYVHGWGNLFQELRGHFDVRFGNQWMEADKRFWSQFEARVASRKKKLIE